MRVSIRESPGISGPLPGMESAAKIYADLHLDFVTIHPFFEGIGILGLPQCLPRTDSGAKRDARSPRMASLKELTTEKGGSRGVGGSGNGGGTISIP